MKMIQMIVGRRQHCYHCGELIRTVLIPQLGNGWHPYKDFEDGAEVLIRHDCAMHPAKNTNGVDATASA